MLTEKLEEIMEAIWGAEENGRHSIEAVQRRCVIDFSKDDLTSSVPEQNQGCDEGDESYAWAEK